MNYKKLTEDVLGWLGFIITLMGMLGVSHFFQ
jgi:hypothetical protein